MKRVVITGAGIVCPIANNYSELGSALKLCKHNIKPVTLFKTDAKHPVAEVQEIDSSKAYFRTGQLALKSIEEAIDSAGSFESIEPNKIALSFSTCTIGMLELENAFTDFKNGRKNDISFYDAFSIGSFADNLSKYFNINGLVTSFSTACSSSLNAIVHGEYLIREGLADIVIAGGADSLCRLTYYGFQSLKVMSDSPCTPFDKNRQGMNIGEGAGFIVLESLESARRRERKIYGEILGSGMSADAYHMTAPNPDGKGAALAMQKALNNAKLSASDINYVSAHGTGTIHNDPAESNAIKKIFGENISNVYVSSIKSYLGHTLGASGAISTICALKTLEDNFIPPTLGLKDVDKLCDITHPSEKGIELPVENILTNSFAFGGNNTSLILGKFYES